MRDIDARCARAARTHVDYSPEGPSKSADRCGRADDLRRRSCASAGNRRQHPLCALNLLRTRGPAGGDGRRSHAPTPTQPVRASGSSRIPARSRRRAAVRCSRGSSCSVRTSARRNGSNAIPSVSQTLTNENGQALSSDRIHRLALSTSRRHPGEPRVWNSTIASLSTASMRRRSGCTGSLRRHSSACCTGRSGNASSQRSLARGEVGLCVMALSSR